MSWMQEAACAGMGSWLFFGPDASEEDSRTKQDIQQAKRICAQCPVRKECYQEGRYEMYGIWGGLTGNERLRKKLGYYDFAETLRETA